jgi:hypothetical protein
MLTSVNDNLTDLSYHEANEPVVAYKTKSEILEKEVQFLKESLSDKALLLASKDETIEALKNK